MSDQAVYNRPPAVYGWRYHLDNTIQFILWAFFGSAAIHLLNIKQKYTEKERRLATKIAVLKDIIKRIGEGEDVDVARELKVGRTEEELEWEEVMNSFKEAAGVPEEQAQGEDPSTQIASSESADHYRSVLLQSMQVDATSAQSAAQAKSSTRGWFWQS